MSIKRLTHIGSIASLLAMELAPTAIAQTIDPPDTVVSDIPISFEQHPQASLQTASSEVTPTVAPERVAIVESAPIPSAPASVNIKPELSPSPTPTSVNIKPEPSPFPTPALKPIDVEPRSSTISPAIAAPERIDSMPLAANLSVSPSHSSSRTVSTRAQDLASQATATLEPQAEAIVEKTTSIKQNIESQKLKGENISITNDQRVKKVSSQPVEVSLTSPASPTSPTSPPVSLVAQTTPSVSPPASSPPPAPAPISPKVGGTFTTGPGVGYSSSFTGLKGFIPVRQQAGRDLTFVEGQAFIDTGNGNPGANLLLGHRVYDQKNDRIYGGYLGYDHRNTGKNGFNQIGLGVETLGRSWDARINAYLPIGNTRQLVDETITTTTTPFSSPAFQDNFLARTRTIQQQIDRRFEAAATGVDLEAGGKIASLGNFGELRGYGGLYYFGAPKGDDTVGFRTRLEARPNENMQVGVALSRDNNYGTNVALTLGVTFPTHRSSAARPVDPLLARLGDPTYRNANIVLDRQVEARTTTTQETQFITNPATGQPWRFRHAIPGVGTGNGTFENPTGTVAEALAVAQPDDIVYVQPGTNPGIPAFTIPDRVQVLSTGPVQRIDTVELGNFQLPLSGAGVLPTVQGTVTMGNSTTLSGFAIGTTTGPGILGNNISQVTIRDNAIANTATQGILLNNVQNQVAITDNTIQRTGSEGILLSNNLGQTNVLLTRNQITNNGVTNPDSDGVAVELLNNATGTFAITNNTIANNGSTGAINDGIDIKLFNAANGTFNVANNSITGNRGSGIVVSQEATTQGTVNLTQNTLSNNQVHGVDVLLSGNAQGQLNLDGNTIANNQFNGLNTVVANQATGTFNLTNNTLNNNQDSGFRLQTSDQAQATATLNTNILNNNVNNGILTIANGTSQLRLQANSNTITANGFPGVSITTNDSARTAASLQTNTVTGNGFTDVEAFNFSPSATTCLRPQTNTIGTLLLDDSIGGQIQVEAGTLATNTITLSDLIGWSNTVVPAGTCGL